MKKSSCRKRRGDAARGAWSEQASLVASQTACPLLGALVAVFLSAPTSVQADAAPDESPALMEPVDTVEVTATIDDEEPVTSSSPTAASSSVSIGPLESATVDLGATLRKAPGVMLRRTGTPGSPMNASIRGSSADQILIKLAGLPLTPPGGGLVDLSSIAPSLVERLIVTRGTDAAIHGAGALGGVIHLEPAKQLLDTDDASCLDDGAEALCLDDSSPSNHDWALRADSLQSMGVSTSWRGKEGPALLSASVDMHGSRGRFGFERALTPNLPDAPWTTEQRLNNGALMGSALLSASAPASDGKLRLTAFGHGARHEVAGMIGFPTPGAFSDTYRSLLGGSFTSDILGPMALRWSTTTWVASDHYSYYPGVPAAPGAGTAFDNRRHILGTRATMEALVAGMVLQLAAETSFESLSGTGVGTSRPAGSLSLSDTVFLLNDRLLLHGAVRLDAFQGQATNVSPRAGARLTLPASLTLFANAARGSRMPTLFELFGQTALVASNEELLPESASTVDCGIELQASRTRARFVGWRSRYRNLISYELHPPLRLRPLNVGRALIDGVEADIVFQPTDWLEMIGVYALTNAVNLSQTPNLDGRLLPYRPRHKGFSQLVIKAGPLTFQVDIEAQSSSPRNRSNSKWLPPRLLAGAGVIAQTRQGYFASLHATNLFDNRRLEDVFGYPLPGRAAFVALGFTD